MLSRMAHDSMRSMVHVECRAILRALASGRRIDVSIHEARKAIRRLRALLALVADAQWGGIKRVDRELQRLGDGLSPLRDAHVAVITAKHCLRAHGEATWTPVVDQLVVRRNALMQQALVDDLDFQRRRERVARIDSTLDRLPWESLDADVLRDGLKRSRRRVAKAKKKAKADPTLDKLHRWRRRARRLRMQLVALGDAKSDEATGLHELGDRLGSLQDLRMLRKLLRQMPDLPQRDAVLLQLRKQIASRKDRLH